MKIPHLTGLATLVAFIELELRATCCGLSEHKKPELGSESALANARARVQGIRSDMFHDGMRTWSICQVAESISLRFPWSQVMGVLDMLQARLEAQHGGVIDV
jgi:hypothetical protein